MSENMPGNKNQNPNPDLPEGETEKAEANEPKIEDMIAVHNHGIEVYNGGDVYGFPVGHVTLVPEKTAKYLFNTHPQWFEKIEDIPEDAAENFEKFGPGGYTVYDEDAIKEREKARKAERARTAILD